MNFWHLGGLWLREAIKKSLSFGLCPKGVDPCKAAKFNSIEYFSTQDFGNNIQSSIFRDKNLTFLNDRVFFNTKNLNIKNDRVFGNANFLIYKQSSIFQQKF